MNIKNTEELPRLGDLLVWQWEQKHRGKSQEEAKRMLAALNKAIEMDYLARVNEELRGE